MSGIGLKRLASQIRLVVSDAIQSKLGDPRLEQIGSITRVEVSPDISYADVYVSVMASEGKQQAYVRALHSAHGVLQKLVARKLRTRTCPTLRFHLDQSLKKGMETIQLIDKTIADMAERQERQGEGSEDDESNPSTESES